MMPTPYQSHIDKWKDCVRCPLHEGRNRVVFARGKIPCDVLFVGEAPGTNENASGYPFDGPAGIKLDEIIQAALDSIIAPIDYSASELDLMTEGKIYQWEPPRIGYYNLVGCYPRKEKEAGTNEPPIEAIKACAPKLREFVELSYSKLIVTVGKLSDKWVPAATHTIAKDPKARAVQWASIVHPAFILRAPLAQQSLLVKKSVITLVQAFKAL